VAVGATTRRRQHSFRFIGAGVEPNRDFEVVEFDIAGSMETTSVASAKLCERSCAANAMLPA
jgi:hypothetical protein